MTRRGFIRSFLRGAAAVAVTGAAVQLEKTVEVAKKYQIRFADGRTFDLVEGGGVAKLVEVGDRTCTRLYEYAYRLGS